MVDAADQFMLDHLKTQAVHPDYIYHGYDDIRPYRTFLWGDFDGTGKPRLIVGPGEDSHPEVISTGLPRRENLQKINYRIPIVLGRIGVLGKTRLLSVWDHHRAADLGILDEPSEDFDDSFIVQHVIPTLLQAKLITPDTEWWGITHQYMGTVQKSLSGGAKQPKVQTYDIQGHKFTFSQLMAVLHTMPKGSQQRQVVEKFICSQNDPIFADTKQRIRCQQAPALRKPAMSRLPQDFQMNSQSALDRAHDAMRGARRKRLSARLASLVGNGGGDDNVRKRTQAARS